jgi:hypothetical protein
VAYEFNTDFSAVLAQRAEFYSSDPAADTINRVRGEISQVGAGGGGGTGGGGGGLTVCHAATPATPFRAPSRPTPRPPWPRTHARARAPPAPR